MLPLRKGMSFSFPIISDASMLTTIVTYFQLLRAAFISLFEQVCLVNTMGIECCNTVAFCLGIIDQALSFDRASYRKGGHIR